MFWYTDLTADMASGSSVPRMDSIALFVLSWSSPITHVPSICHPPPMPWPMVSRGTGSFSGAGGIAVFNRSVSPSAVSSSSPSEVRSMLGTYTSLSSGARRKVVTVAGAFVVSGGTLTSATGAAIDVQSSLYGEHAGATDGSVILRNVTTATFFSNAIICSGDSLLAPSSCVFLQLLDVTDVVAPSVSLLAPALFAFLQPLDVPAVVAPSASLVRRGLFGTTTFFGTAPFWGGTFGTFALFAVAFFAGAFDPGAFDPGALGPGAFGAGAFGAGAFGAGAFGAGAFGPGAFGAGAFGAGAVGAGAFFAGAVDAGAVSAGAFSLSSSESEDSEDELDDDDDDDDDDSLDSESDPDPASLVVTHAPVEVTGIVPLLSDVSSPSSSDSEDNTVDVDAIGSFHSRFLLVPPPIGGPLVMQGSD